MVRLVLSGLAVMSLGACAGYCPVDHSGLEAPPLWSADGASRMGASEHAGGLMDAGPR